MDGCPPFRPILSALRTLTYKLAKFLVPILEPLTTNKYIVKDSFNFATEIVEQDSTKFMGSLDIYAPKNNGIVIGLKKSEFKDFLSLPTQESYFIFNNILHKQIDGVAIGSPLGPSTANALLACHKQDFDFDKYSLKYRPLHYRRYVNDIFILFKSSDHLK